MADSYFKVDIIPVEGGVKYDFSRDGKAHVFFSSIDTMAGYLRYLAANDANHIDLEILPVAGKELGSNWVQELEGIVKEHNTAGTGASAF